VSAFRASRYDFCSKQFLNFYLFYKFLFLLHIIFMKYLLLNVMSSICKTCVLNYSSYNNSLVFSLIIIFIKSFDLI